MIVLRRTGFAIDKLHIFDMLSKTDIDNIAKEEEMSNLDLTIPEIFKSNSDRNTYKVGFVCSFLKRLYSEKKFDEIVNIMNSRYQIFLSRRQIERVLVKFNSDEKFTK